MYGQLGRQTDVVRIQEVLAQTARQSGHAKIGDRRSLAALRTLINSIPRTPAQ